MSMGLRVSEDEESEGVDISECGLQAYPELSKSVEPGPVSYTHLTLPTTPYE